jgi:hypothetical protein
MSADRVQELQLNRYQRAWTRSSPYLPMIPVADRPARSWRQRLRRWLWRAFHRRY